MDRTEVRRLMQQALGNSLWARSQGDIAKADALYEEVTRYLAVLPTAPVETNDRGNEVYRNEDAEEKLGIKRGDERYFYDFGPLQSWKQYDTSQDAHYFGVWVNLEQRMTFTYCEGDRILVICPTQESLAAELVDMERFYGDPPPAWIVIDSDGKRTDVYDPRPAVEVVG